MPDFVATLAADDTTLVVAIVAARLLVPLLIPRFPLVIIVALALDGADNSLLAQFTEIDLTADGPYQSWDKALDIYYLAIAYLSTMRNWTSDAAFRISQFLFYYRLLGVVLFVEVDDRDVGALARECDGDRAADAAVAAGDQGSPALELAAAAVLRALGLRTRRHLRLDPGPALLRLRGTKPLLVVRLALVRHAVPRRAAARWG